jgi:hypothetical protein
MGRTEVCRRNGGIGPDVCRAAVGDEPSEVQHVDLVAHVRHEVHVVIDEEDRRPLVADVTQAAAQPLALAGVEPACRFVQEEHRRVADERPGDRHELALALGELTDRTLGMCGQAQEGKNLVGPAVRTGRADRPAAAAAPTATFSVTLRSS